MDVTTAPAPRPDPGPDARDRAQPFRRRFASVTSRGIVAGIVGATAMALFFLIVDGSQGQPFRTPAFLARALLGDGAVAIGAGPIALYTLIHYGAFIVVGLAVSWLLTMVETASPVLLGLVLGFLMFDLVFYGSVIVTGVDIVSALGWPEVLAGNLIAGISVLGFLHLAGATRPVTWWEALGENRVVREGLVAGLIGALIVAAWFLVFDLFRGQPLFTPGALGSVLFLGAGGLAEVQVNLATVAGYTVLHFGAFMVVGLLAAGIVTAADETPPLILGAVLFFVAFEAFFMGLLAMVAEFLLGPLAWWTIMVGNLLAAGAMGWYLWEHHPRLREALREDPLDRTD